MSRPRSPIPRSWSVAIDFGYTLLAAELLLGGGGYWLDKRFATGPWISMVGVILGLLVSFRSLLSSLNRIEKAEKEAQKGKGRDGE